jgi:predicted AAA+ superfamily ATPase
MVIMKNRSVAHAIEKYAFSGHKIAFLSGPRQCGKTTLAKMFLQKRATGLYKNWDDIAFRRIWAMNPSSLIPQGKGKEIPLVVLDEIHKDRRWKRNLKGVYDTLEKPCDFLVTGSARLNVYRKGSDSLLGRHLNFRIHPFTVREMERPDVLSPDKLLSSLFGREEDSNKAVQKRLESLMAYGPFPEPLLAQDRNKALIWHHNREQLVIREDLRDLSHLPELGRIEMMTAMLPEKIGSMMSLASLGRDLETSIPTTKRWLSYLKELYYLFEIKPYTKSVPRSLRKEGKIYLWDYSFIPDESAKFENLVACHLLKTCNYWTDTGEGVFDLFFLRDKQKHEIDFLVVRDGVPWLPVEVKSSDIEPSKNWSRFLAVLPCKRGLQLVNRAVWNSHKLGNGEVLVAGAAEALHYFA